MKITIARRLAKLPPYLFVEIDRLKEKMVGQGVDVIDMGVGDPDTPTPPFVIEAMKKALSDPQHHQYPSNWGLGVLRVAIAGWMKKRFGVNLDPKTEILPLIGSKEGIAHLPLAFVNPGDSVLVPDPCYPPYRTGTILAGGNPVTVPLLADNDFLPDLAALRKKTRRAKLFFLNYPNNPTAAVADLGFFKDLVRFAQKTGVPICHDAAYSEMTFDDWKSPSFLQVPGAKEVGIEYHSFSKSFNMTGWRLGWVCGNARMVAALARVKSNIDSGVFQAIQMAGIEALRLDRGFMRRMVRIYQSRRDLFVAALRKAGLPAVKPRATFYLWVPLLAKSSSKKTSSLLLLKAGIVAAPGIGFGRFGEGYIRFSLSVPTARIQEAAKRLGRLSLK